MRSPRRPRRTPPGPSSFPAGETSAGILGLTGLPAGAQTTDEVTGSATDRLDRVTRALAGLVDDGTLTQDQADRVAETLASSAALRPVDGLGHGPRLGLTWPPGDYASPVLAGPAGRRRGVGMTAEVARHAGAKYVALALMWGSSFLFIRVALEGLSPAQVVLGRLGVGALTLALIMVATRRRWPREPRVLRHLGVLALLLGVIPFLLFSWAGQYIPSGLSSIYNATTPIMTLLVSLVALPTERLTPVRTAALLLAGAGVVVVAGPWAAVTGTAGEHFYLAQLAALGATSCYGAGYVYMRRFVTGYRYDAVTVAATQVGLAALIMLALAPVVARSPVTLTPAVVGSVLALGALSTGVAYIWNTDVVRAWGATLASTVTYLTPVVGVLLGVVVLAESLSVNQPIGASVVVLGILVGQGQLTLPRRPARTTPPPPAGGA